MKVFAPESLRRIVLKVCQGCHIPADESGIWADHLVDANLLGFDSHGVIRIPQYLEEIETGQIIPGAPVTVTRETSTTAIVDMGWNLGQVGAMRATEIVVRKAKQHGMASVILNRTNHIGCLSIYARWATKYDLICLVYCGSGGNGQMVCPFGGQEGRLGPGPICYGIPTEGDPLVADFSTSAAAEGKIRLHRNLGRQMPLGWVLDVYGNPTTNPQEFYGPPQGVILPFGGEQGYKGYALGIIAQVLSTQLGGINWRPNCPEARGNATGIMAIDIECFTSIRNFRQEMSEYIKFLKSAKTAPGFEEIFVPGEIENRCRQERLKNGIPIDDETWRQIEQVALRVGVDLQVEKLHIAEVPRTPPGEKMHTAFLA